MKNIIHHIQPIKLYTCIIAKIYMQYPSTKKAKNKKSMSPKHLPSMSNSACTPTRELGNFKCQPMTPSLETFKCVLQLQIKPPAP